MRGRRGNPTGRCGVVRRRFSIGDRNERWECGRERRGGRREWRRMASDGVWSWSAERRTRRRRGRVKRVKCSGRGKRRERRKKRGCRRKKLMEIRRIRDELHGGGDLRRGGRGSRGVGRVGGLRVAMLSMMRFFDVDRRLFIADGKWKGAIRLVGTGRGQLLRQSCRRASEGRQVFRRRGIGSPRFGLTRR